MAKPRVSEVVRDVYIVTIGRGALSTNVYQIRSGSSWTLVDAGWFGCEKKIRAAAESVFGPGARPASMVLTHLHTDHSGSAARLADCATALRPACTPNVCAFSQTAPRLA